MVKEKNKIKQALISQRRTQSWLSKKIGLSEPTVSVICNKGSKNIDTLKSIAEALEMKLIDLID